MDPSNLKYAKSHEWVGIDGDMATIGISDFAVKQLTDLVYIEMPEVGASLVAGKMFGEVESVKAVSDIFAPISGEVTQVNEALDEDLSVLSQDPFGAGWIVKLKISDAGALDDLLDRAAYDAYCASEEH